MPTDTELKARKTEIIVGKQPEFIIFFSDNPPVEQAKVWHLGQEKAPQDTKGIGFTVTLVTPMHEVKFNDALWDKLDRLSGRTPDPYVEDDDL